MERKPTNVPAKPSVSSRTPQKGPNLFADGDDDDFSSYFKPKSTNPFDEDKSDDLFRKPPASQKRSPFDDLPEEKLLSPQELYQQEILKIQDRTLAMTSRSVKMLDESEALGTAAAQELLAQREQLENADRNLDNMNSTLDQSQRHINNIKSIFGGIKNWWTSKPAPTSSTPQAETAEKLRGLVDSNVSQKPRAPSLSANESSNIPESKKEFSTPSSNAPSSFKQYEAALDNNLDTMSSAVSRLRFLADGLGQEIDQQNKLLDNMQTKTENVSTKMAGQQTSIDKILGKKKS